jgi:hypothetical protein
VTVEPKRRKQAPSPQLQPMAYPSPAMMSPIGETSSLQGVESMTPRGSGREMRRARIVITVKRTENYKRWLEENPLQAIIAGDGGDDDEEEEDTETDLQPR